VHADTAGLGERRSRDSHDVVREAGAVRRVPVSRSGAWCDYAWGGVNGDGREDFLTEIGWYERPGGDPFAGPWKLHPESALPHPSCPFAVLKRKSRRRLDILFGKAHNYGLYWWEQLPAKADGTTVWKEHSSKAKSSQKRRRARLTSAAVCVILVQSILWGGSMQRTTLAVVLVLLLCGVSAGQDTRATLSGLVTDSSQAAVVAAVAKLIRTDTGVILETTTNSTGQYRFLFLNPGAYRLIVEMPGFRQFERSGIVLQVGQSANVDVTLQVGAQTETVTVTSNAVLLETEKGDRGLVVDKVNITDLPLNVRNPIMLAHLSPGVTHTSGTAHLNPFSNSGISSWSVNGGLNNNTEFLMDGAPNNAFSGRTNRIAYVPPADAVEEFKVMTTIYDAQYGRTGGGIINVSSKSGTNQWRGTAYEFLKRTALNANTFSNNAKKLPRQGASLNQYGFTVGGPVRIPKLYDGRDRTFIFFAGGLRGGPSLPQ
jgi:hypothetical protein